MSKESGLGMSLSVDDSTGSARDIANDVSQISFGTPQGLIDVTGIDKSAMERIVGMSDGTVQLTLPAFNDTSNKSFDVFKTRSGVRTVAIGISGNTLSMEMLIANVQHQRGNDGALSTTVDLQLADGTVPTWA